MDFDNIKQERKALRSAFTKVVNILEGLLKSIQKDTDEVEICMEQLTEKYETLCSIDKNYFELFQKKGCKEAEFEKEYETAQEYYDKFSECKVKVSKFTKKINDHGGIIASS